MKIELPDEVVDEIIIEGLKNAYLLNCIPDKYDCSDDEIEVDLDFLKALYIVMEYFMPKDELHAWLQYDAAIFAKRRE